MTSPITQLALDGRDPRVKTYMQKWYGPDWWAAKCTVCGGALTKYDHSEEEAYRGALDALDTPGHFQHRCTKPVPVRAATSSPSRRAEQSDA